MDIKAYKYFDQSDADKRYLQLLTMHKFVAEGNEMGYDTLETLTLMYDHLEYLLQNENYEGAALIRDAIELYDKEFEGKY